MTPPALNIGSGVTGFASQFNLPAPTKPNPRAWPKRPLTFGFAGMTPGQLPNKTETQHVFYKLKPAANSVPPSQITPATEPAQGNPSSS